MEEQDIEQAWFWEQEPGLSPEQFWNAVVIAEIVAGIEDFVATDDYDGFEIED